MSSHNRIIVGKHEEELARFFASLSNTTRIAILEKLACRDNCENNINEIGGLSRFTIGMNIKYLKKHGLIKGSLTSKNISYCLNYNRLDEFKTLFDEFYNKVTQNRTKLNNGDISCTNKK